MWGQVLAALLFIGVLACIVGMVFKEGDEDE